MLAKSCDVCITFDFQQSQVALNCCLNLNRMLSEGWRAKTLYLSLWMYCAGENSAGDGAHNNDLPETKGEGKAVSSLSSLVMYLCEVGVMQFVCSSVLSHAVI